MRTLKETEPNLAFNKAMEIAQSAGTATKNAQQLNGTELQAVGQVSQSNQSSNTGRTAIGVAMMDTLRRSVDTKTQCATAATNRIPGQGLSQ